MTRIIAFLSLLGLAASVAVADVPPVICKPFAPPVPQLAAWESRMLTFGKAACDHLAAQPGDFNATYYDAESVFIQVADYTKDPSWLACADRAEKSYRDGYVLPNNGNVPGYWNFTRGLTADALRTRDQLSVKAVHLLATNGAFAPDTAYNNAYLVSVAGSRETAYVLMAYLDDEKLGQPLNPRFKRLAGYALGHLKTWTACGSKFVNPFMVALTVQALVQYQERTGDPLVLPAVRAAADFLWDAAWNPAARAFAYCVGDCTGEPAADLNLLVAPVYSWVFRMTGDRKYQERGDAVFSGGVPAAYLGDGKHFDQNYRWSFDFILGR